MPTLRDMIDGKSVQLAGKDDDVFEHLKQAADAKNNYETTKLKLATKMAPARELLKGVDVMHPPNPDPNDPFQNPMQQTGAGGPGGVGQGLQNQDDLARTGQMQRPATGSTIQDYMNQKAPQPGAAGNNGNKRLQTPESNKAQGKAPQRSESGMKQPKTAGGVDGKPAKKSKKVKVEITDDKMSADYHDNPGVSMPSRAIGANKVINKAKQALHGLSAPSLRIASGMAKR